MIKAAEKLVPIYVDCEWGKSYRSLTDKYGIRGYPTVVFTNPEGEEVASLIGRSASAVRTQIDEVAAKHTVVITFHPSWEKALQVAKKEKKPILFLFCTGDAIGKFLEGAIADSSNKKLRSRFVLAKSKPDTADAEKFKVAKTRTSVLLVLDYREEKPEDKQYRLPPDTESVKDLITWLTAVAEKLEK